MAGEKGVGGSSEAVSQPPGGPAAAGSRTVFLSYASPDAAVANQVCEFIESHGIPCWMAPRDVKPGAAYADAIVRAINEASALVLVLSASAMASEHVSREVERAASKRKQVVAFRVDEAALSAELEYFLSRSQWIDVPALGMPGALVKLTEAVGRGPAAQPSPGLGDAKSSGRSTIARAVGTASAAKRLVVAAAVVIALGLGGVLAVRFSQSKHGVGRTPEVATVSDKSIAVLPFTDMSQKKDQEYFGDGMAEEILDLLAKIPGLTVIGRTSSFQFKGKNEDLRKIGSELNAAYVLEGSVRNSDDQVRITAQLINTKTGAHEWSETYDRPIGDVLKLQDAIAAAVVRELQLTVDPDYVDSRSFPENGEVYDLYLRGRHSFDRHEKESLDEAATLFERALERDPSFADAAVWLGWTKSSQGQFGFLPAADAFEGARRAATTALRLDPKRADAHAVLGAVYTIYDWNWGAAEQEFRQVAALAPGSMDDIYGQEQLALTFGRWDDALKHIKAAIAHDPLDPDGFFLLSGVQACRGRLPEAEASMRRVLAIRPAYSYAHYYLGLVLLMRGDRDGALLEMQREPTDDGKQQGLVIVFQALGRKAEADAALAGMLKDQGDRNGVGIADIYALRGQSDEAIRWLERAYVQKDPELYVVKSETELQGLKADPRFKAFLKKMNLPE